MTRLAWLLLVASIATAQAAEAPVALDPPTDFAFAGLKIALPKEWHWRIPGDGFIVARLVKGEQESPTLSLTIAAMAQPKDTSLKKFVDFAKPKPGLVLRDLKLVKLSRVEVAGMPGQVRIITYEMRGVETTAVVLFFLRPMETNPIKMGYIVTVESEKKYGRQLLPVLKAVIGTIELFDPVRPVSQEINSLAEPVRSRKWGYAFRPPRLWKAKASRGLDNIMFFQTDYLMANMPMPQGALAVRAQAGSPESCAKAALKRLQDDLKERKQDFEIVREGPAVLAERRGYGFLLRQKIPPATTTTTQKAPTQRLMIAQRTTCANGNSYSLVLFYQAEKVEDAVAAMDAIAGGFELSAAAGVTTTIAPGTGPSEAPSETILPAYR